MRGRKNWPWTEKQRKTLRQIKLWRRPSKGTEDTNFERGRIVTWLQIANRLNGMGWLGPGGLWTAQAVARQSEKSDKTPLRKPKKRHLEVHEYLTYDQIRTCKKVCRDRDRLILDFLLATGLRPGCEFAKLQCGDLEFHLTGPVIHIRKGKRGNKRFVKISKKLSRRLQNGGAESSPMFPDTKGEKLSARALRKRLAILGVKAKVGALYPYRLRHSFGTILYDNGNDILNVAEQMGHADVNTSRIYAKVLETASSEQADALQARLDSLDP